MITAIDGKALTSVDDLSAYINTKNVGDTVTLSILRGGSTVSVQVTLGARPANITAGSTPNMTLLQTSNRISKCRETLGGVVVAIIIEMPFQPSNSGYKNTGILFEIT